MARRLNPRSFIFGFAASAMAPPASRAQTVEQFNAGKNEPRRRAASRAPMSRIIDSEAHTWVKIPNNWRHHAPDEPRAPRCPTEPRRSTPGQGSSSKRRSLGGVRRVAHRPTPCERTPAASPAIWMPRNSALLP
jgi:hypothetical protein